MCQHYDMWMVYCSAQHAGSGAAPLRVNILITTRSSLLLWCSFQVDWGDGWEQSWQPSSDIIDPQLIQDYFDNLAKRKSTTSSTKRKGMTSPRGRGSVGGRAAAGSKKNTVPRKKDGVQKTGGAHVPGPPSAPLPSVASEGRGGLRLDLHNPTSDEWEAMRVQLPQISPTTFKCPHGVRFDPQRKQTQITEEQEGDMSFMCM